MAVEHGTISRYTNLRCRCGECRSAWAAYVKRRKQERTSEGLRPDDPRHGKASTYGNHGCRCEACTKAWSAETLERNHRRKARENG